jgi:hypothetical protein
MKVEPEIMGRTKLTMVVYYDSYLAGYRRTLSGFRVCRISVLLLCSSKLERLIIFSSEDAEY